MAKDLAVSFGIGVAMEAGAKTVFRSTVEHLDDLGKTTIKANEQASARIAGRHKLDEGPWRDPGRGAKGGRAPARGNLSREPALRPADGEGGMTAAGTGR